MPYKKDTRKNSKFEAELEEIIHSDKDFQDNLDAFESNINRMMQSGIYESKASTSNPNRSRKFETFKGSLDAFELNIERMMQTGIYGNKTRLGNSNRSLELEKIQGNPEAFQSNVVHTKQGGICETKATLGTSGPSWKLEQFKGNLDAFESNIDRMMQSGIYVNKAGLCNSDRSRKRRREDVDVEAIFARYRLPALLGSIDDKSTSKPLSKVQNKRKGFESKINSRLQGNNAGLGNSVRPRKRSFKDPDVEAIFAEYRLPALLGSLDNGSNSKPLSKFQNKRKDFESKINSRLQGNNSSLGSSVRPRKRSFKDMEVEAIFAEYRLPALLSPIHDWSNSKPVSKVQNKRKDFESKINSRLQGGIYGNKATVGNSIRPRKRSFKDMEIEAIFAEYRLPALLSAINDKSNFQPLSKRFKIVKKNRK